MGWDKKIKLIADTIRDSGLTDAPFEVSPNTSFLDDCSLGSDAIRDHILPKVKEKYNIMWSKEAAERSKTFGGLAIRLRNK